MDPPGIDFLHMMNGAGRDRQERSSAKSDAKAVMRDYPVETI
jgi:hypothetical protein